MNNSCNTQDICHTFMPPRVHDIILRQRLDTMLDSAQKKPLILVEGQAAQGKSTLVASYFNRCSNEEQHVVWLHLSKRESEHTNLFDLLTSALSLRFSFSHTDHTIEKLNPSPATLGTGEELSRQVDMVLALFTELPSPVAVVLDNLESLDDNASSRTLIQKLINALLKNATGIQLILISRQLPPLGISRLKMEHACLVLKNEDLAFSLDETACFFKQRHSLPFSCETVKKIHNITHGWAGGLALISESMERGVDISRLPHHLTAEALDYFSHEIYNLLPHAIKHFLIRVSLFDEIDADIAENLCDTPNAREILMYLENRNLFIQRLAGRTNQVRYRFNTLFKNFLFKALTETLSSHGLKKLNIQAAKFFEQRGEIELAVRYYFEGDDFDMAADMIKKCATDLIVKGSLPKLVRWLEALPAPKVQQDPWLIFYLTMTHRIKGGRRNVDDFLKAFKLFDAQGDIRGSMLSTAYLIEAAVFVRKSSQRIAEWILQGETLLAQRRGDHLFSWAQALLWQQIAFGYIAGEVDVQKGLSSIRNARLLAKKINNREIELNASIIMAFGYVRTGNFPGAGKLLKTLKNLTHEVIHPEYRALNHLIRIDLELKEGNFDTAEKFLSESEADVEKFGLIFLYPGFIQLKAMHSIHTHRFETAQRLAEHLSDFSILSGNTFYLALAHHIKAIVHYHSQSFKQAGEASKKALELFYEKKGEDAHLYTAKQLHGMILIRQKKFKAAHRELTQALDYFAKASSDMSWCETRFALGLLCWEDNKSGRAEEHIPKALTRAVQEGYERFSLMAPWDLVKVLTLSICFDGTGKLLTRLSSLMTADPLRHASACETVTQLLSHPIIVENAQWLNRLKELYRQLLPRITINTLGHFSVLINDLPIAESAWEGNKPKLLLKSIICRNAKEISKEKVIEDIWPKASVKAGEKNFKVNLHRLRKALEPDVDKKMGYTYITLDAGRISLNTRLVTVDIDMFHHLLTKGYGYLAQDGEQLALSFFEKAVMLYKGDFLAEEPYESWIDVKREALKTNFIEILMTLARIHEEQEQPLKAIQYLKKAIGTDPLHEEAYRNLMIVYADFRMLAAAMELYEKCRQTLREELDVEPDSETRNIYKKIASLHLTR